MYTPHINHRLCGYTTYTPWCIHSICTMENVSCIRGAAYAEQYHDPSCVRHVLNMYTECKISQLYQQVSGSSFPIFLYRCAISELEPHPSISAGPFLRTGFSILSRKGISRPHPPTLKSFHNARVKPVHQLIHRNWYILWRASLILVKRIQCTVCSSF